MASGENTMEKLGMKSTLKAPTKLFYTGLVEDSEIVYIKIIEKMVKQTIRGPMRGCQFLKNRLGLTSIAASQ